MIDSNDGNFVLSNEMSIAFRAADRQRRRSRIRRSDAARGTDMSMSDVTGHRSVVSGENAHCALHSCYVLHCSRGSTGDRPGATDFNAIRYI